MQPQQPEGTNSVGLLAKMRERYVGAKQYALQEFRVNLAEMDEATGVEVKTFNEKAYNTQSMGAQHAQVDFKNPEEHPRELFRDGDKLDAFVAAVMQEVQAPEGAQEQGKWGRTDCLQYDDKLGDRHAYKHVTYSLPVPSMFQSAMENLATWLPFRGMLTQFPPAAGEVAAVPQIQPQPLDPTFSLDNPAVEIEQDRRNALHQAERLLKDIPPTGPVHLGQVAVYASHPIIRRYKNFVIRGALMSTSELHALDGEAGWLQVYNIENKTVTFIAVGGGRNSVPGVDEINNRTAGLVFSTMVHSFVQRMKDIDATHGSSNLLTDSTTLVDFVQLTQSNPRLAKRRALAGTFDLFSRIMAVARQTEGMYVMSSPTDNGIEIAVTFNKPAFTAPIQKDKPFDE